METSAQTTTPTPTGTLTQTATNAIAAAIPRRSQTARAAALTRKQRDQLFDEAAAGMVPERAKTPVENPLQRWWPQIKRKLDQGFSVRQVHDLTCAPKINLGVGLRTLQRFIKAQQAAAKQAKLKGGGGDRS